MWALIWVTIWSGAVEAKANLNKSDAFDTNGVKISQKDKYSIGYQQGYRVTKDLMPYAKAEYINSKFDDARANWLWCRYGTQNMLLPIMLNWVQNMYTVA